jgi:hypothetical protein
MMIRKAPMFYVVLLGWSCFIAGDTTQEHCTESTTLYGVVRSTMDIMPLIVWQLAFLLLLVWIFYKNRITLSAVCLLLCLGILVSVSYYERSQRWVVIAHEDVAVYLGPGMMYPRQGSLNVLDEVRVLSERDEWCQIEKNGVIGWIPHAYC